MAKAAPLYVREQAAAAALINVLLNAGLAWLLYRHLAVVPMWGSQSIMGDLLVTAFLVPLLISLLITPAVRRDIANGRVELEGGEPLGSRFVRRLPRSPLVLGVLLGVAAASLIAGLTASLLTAVGRGVLSFAAFATLKASVAGLVALLATPWIVRRALTRGR